MRSEISVENWVVFGSRSIFLASDRSDDAMAVWFFSDKKGFRRNGEGLYFEKKF